MLEDEKNLQLRRDWDEFYDTPLVGAIVERKGKPHDGEGSDFVKQYSAVIVDENGDEYRKMNNIRIKRGDSDDLTKAINAVIELAKLVDSNDDDVGDKLKSTYDLIDGTNQKIEKVFVSENLLKKNFKDAWDTFIQKLDITLAIKDDDTLKTAKTQDIKLVEPGELMMTLDDEFTKYSNATKKKSLVNNNFMELYTSAIDMYKDSATDEKKKLLYDKIQELNVSKSEVDKALVGDTLTPTLSRPTQPASPQSPQYISISGNKYSVGSKDKNGSQEMVYDEGTKCWKKQLSGGATKSKKKRGPKSRPKSSTKSRPKSRRY